MIALFVTFFAMLHGDIMIMEQLINLTKEVTCYGNLNLVALFGTVSFILHGEVVIMKRVINLVKEVVCSGNVQGAGNEHFKCNHIWILISHPWGFKPSSAAFLLIIQYLNSYFGFILAIIFLPFSCSCLSLQFYLILYISTSFQLFESLNFLVFNLIMIRVWKL